MRTDHLVYLFSFILQRNKMYKIVPLYTWTQTRVNQSVISVLSPIQIYFKLNLIGFVGQNSKNRNRSDLITKYKCRYLLCSLLVTCCVFHKLYDKKKKKIKSVHEKLVRPTQFWWNKKLKRTTLDNNI